jgi:hypothetical protein
VEEVDEDRHEDDQSEALDNGSYMSDGNLVVNFEVMFDQVRKYEADFVDKNDYVLNYKNNVSYFNTAKPEIVIVETYLVLTKRYLYLFDLSQEEYPLIIEPPIKIEELAGLQLSLNNTLAGVFKTKPIRATPKHIIVEDDTMEDLVTFIKAAFGTKIPLEY